MSSFLWIVSVCWLLWTWPLIYFINIYYFPFWFSATLMVIKGMLCFGLEGIMTFGERRCECLHHDNGIIFYCDHNNSTKVNTKQSFHYPCSIVSCSRMVGLVSWSSLLQCHKCWKTSIFHCSIRHYFSVSLYTNRKLF